MKTYNKEELNTILENHSLWLADFKSGEKAGLRLADLSGTDLRYADLRHAGLGYANLSGADLSGTDLRYADLRCADLGYANLSGTNLRHADLSGTDLRYADLSGADLRHAGLGNTVGNNKEIQTIQTPTYTLNITKDIIQIGCERHSIADWQSYSDSTINDMDLGALEWWRVYKPIIQSLLEAKVG